jgi:hypothetical protein
VLIGRTTTRGLLRTGAVYEWWGRRWRLVTADEAGGMGFCGSDGCSDFGMDFGTILGSEVVFQRMTEWETVVRILVGLVGFWLLLVAIVVGVWHD